MNKKSFRNPLSRVFSGGASKTGSDDGAAVESLREEIRRLRQSVETLSILNDLAVAMGTSSNPDDAIEKLVDRSMRAVNAEQAVVTLLDRSESPSMETQVRIVSSSAQHQSYSVNESLLGWMLLNKKPLVISDPSKDHRFKGISWDDTIRSVMCLPLMIKSELIGILTIFNKKGAAGDGFNADDESLMSIIGAQSAQIIENSKLAKEKSSMEEQVKLAFEIQRNLLPKHPPKVEGYDIAGSSIPAQSVGGDYFDFIPIDDKRLAICLGDVSGKGLPASLLMANVQATLRGQTLVDAPANERIGRANKLLYRCTDDERFVTLFYGVLDFAGHKLDYCSAGHEQPFVVSADGKVSRLETGGLALGVFENVQYQQETVSLNSGDVLIAYSDGITDAANASNQPFGSERLASLIGEYRNDRSSLLIERIVDGVNRHAGDTPQFDDLTVLVIKRTK
jgi:sigma-B regulation protein RsbU (phosphoserine phosphatase)